MEKKSASGSADDVVAVRGLETLIRRIKGPGAPALPDPHFDVVIVGSGYGGAVAAEQLACCANEDGTPLRVAVLERGREYLPGMFPARMAELAGHVRFSTPHQSKPRGERTGLFDVRVGPDLQVLLASGLGGGSLINAGVMEMPHRSVFAEPAWPRDIRDDVMGLFVRSKTMSERLGAHHRGVEGAPLGPPTKYAALRRMAVGSAREPLGFRTAPITVALTGDTTAAGIARNACIGCGDCATGCNHAAKNSLDVTLLEQARQNGAQLYTGATVLRLQDIGHNGGGKGWELVVVHTDDKLRCRQGEPLLLTATRVILAAGSLGSTELLLRSQLGPQGLKLSKRLGHGFSANGDQLGAVFDGHDDVHAVADESQDPHRDGGRGIGPTITGTIDLRHGDPERDFVVQDLAIPGPLRRLFEEVFTTADTFDSFARGADKKGAGAADRDPCAVDPQRIRRTLPVALIGRDSACGRLHLATKDGHEEHRGKRDCDPQATPAASGAPDDKDGDGCLTVVWPELRNDPRWAGFYERLGHLVEASGSGGHALANPLWRPVPAVYEQMFGVGRGPMMSVHPLGGCAMGDDAESAVVDHLGRVFRCDSNGGPELHEGLVVLDGSIVPTSLGINPALTIATLASRAIDGLLQPKVWKLTRRDSRPVQFRSLATYHKPLGGFDPIATEIEVAEQLRGSVDIEGDGPRHAELTLRFKPEPIDTLIGPTGDRLLQVDPSRSRLRVLSRAPDVLSRRAEPDTVEVVAKVTGTLRVFEFEAPSPVVGELTTLWELATLGGNASWLRDKVEALIDRPGGWPTLRGLLAPNAADWRRLKAVALDAGGNAGRALHALSMLASVVGGARVLEYDLQVEAPEGGDKDANEKARRRFRHWLGDAQPHIHGRKRVVLRGAESPWQQMMDLSLARFPRVVVKPGFEPVLSLDLPFFREEGMALLRVTRQQDQPNAMVDVAALLLYVLRMVLRVHLFSFRPPPIPPERVVKRLPGHVPGLPRPRIREVPVQTREPGSDDGASKGKTTTIRLVNYRPRNWAPYTGTGRGLPPVLLIHGYSAGGTNFAHPAVRPNLASYLCDRGRDVWIVDMRTSPGMPHATKPWSMEQVGCEDIPVAIHTILGHTKAAQLDIVAHCMGSAMLFMGLLFDLKPTCWGTQKFKPEPSEAVNTTLLAPSGNVLYERVRRIAMSQIGPAMIMSPANVARAYLMRYIKQFLPLGEYRFRLEPDSAAGQRVLDALLATLPYPPDEMLRHAAREPWLGTRLRMDILYGRDFKLANMSDEVLASIDDFFGPLNVDTVSQAIHFARYNLITERTGFNAFIDSERLGRLASIPMLHVHGSENGLADPSTQTALERLLRSASSQLKLERRLFKGFGHQDCLIGKQSPQVFRAIDEFLAKEIA